MTSRDRVRAALAGAPVDRPPVSFWGHAYHRETSAAELVEATLEFWRAYHWDWVKLNPRKHYHVEPWGVRYRYSGVPDEKPVLEDWPIRAPVDWGRITPREPDDGALGEQLDAVRMLRGALPADVPLIETVFTPLAVLGEMVPEPQDVLRDLRAHPEQVRRALEAVCSTYERFVARVLEAGADGIYLATVDWASQDLLEAEEYRAWARPTDLRILRAVEHAPFNVLHVCKRRNLLAAVADYPVGAFSWAATDPTNPSLADGLARVRGAVMGGISQDGALQESDPGSVLEETRRALAETGGRRWMVAPGCSIPPTTPSANLRAVRDAVEAARPASRGASA
jgi:uroporphyrinogen decarboxylase